MSRPASRSTSGALAALEALLARFRAPRLAELPPFHGGVVGYLGYDVVREVEHLPTRAGRSDRLARRGARAHRSRHRVRPLPPAALPDRERLPRAGRRRRRDRHRVRPRREPARRSRGRARRARCRTRRRRRRTTSSASCRRSPRTFGSARVPAGGRGGAGAHPRRRHLPGRARAAVRSRRSLRAVRRVPRAPAGEPVAVHVLPAPPARRRSSARRRSRWCRCSAVGSSAARSPARASAGAPRSTTA